MNVGHHATVGDGDGAEKLRELLVVPHCQLNVARNDSRFLVVTSGVSGKFKNL